MYARMTTLHVQPGREDDFLLILRNQGVPAFLSIDGFINAYVCIDRDQHQEVLTTIWYTQSQAERAATYDPWQHLLARLQPILAAKPCSRVYELALWT